MWFFPILRRMSGGRFAGLRYGQPEIRSVHAGGNTYVAVPVTILQPDARAVTGLPPQVSRMLAREKGGRRRIARRAPILLTARGVGSCDARATPRDGASALVLPTLMIARRFSANACPGLVAMGFDKLILPCEFDASLYQETALVAPKPLKRSNARLFFESVQDDVGHVLRRARDKILRRTKKKAKRRRKPSAQNSVSPLLSIPPVPPEEYPIEMKLWFSRFARHYFMLARKAEPLRSGDKIVVFTHGLVSGGAERQWVYLAKGLAKLGYV